MTFLYQLAVLGAPTEAQIRDLSQCIATALEKFNLRLGHEVAWDVLPASFKPHQLQPSAAVFFGGDTLGIVNLEELLERGVPVLPVVSDLNKQQAELPEILQPLNCLNYTEGGAQHIANALLECVGLLPYQRRVFISHHHSEASAAALQLYEALSARQFDVFLDTHGNEMDEDVKALSWHKLYDTDVLLMLDTPSYFDDRWTNAEFGRVLAKGISILRVSWPEVTPSRRSATAWLTDLKTEDIHVDTGLLEEGALENVCLKLKEIRSQNHAIRSVNIISNLRIAIQAIGGKMLGVSTNRAMHMQLPAGQFLTVYPTFGVPTPVLLDEALNHTSSPEQSVAVIYDPIGMCQKGLHYLDWLNTHAQPDSWIKVTEASQQFEHWGNH
ncbi:MULTISPECIES: toll/interleukin-1 receptor domain-containing protein [unclassified Methylophilus]|uniref:toll/interleukin-1 receptor domain-containing protein n=1 Tax=unclassified Methylophilus TaxID=2630143 RepID=UPI0006FC4487|nr:MULTISPECIES: toll/interleukin-1 receptor domain-containing protein [unclassified Methylophilus]KQT42427.1 hypothetical protein ASG34_06695 [Methylophilus sp. Leaf416]KQT56610.1 hypothetical protein ASG44_06670 [Methylophilus sp. Leaf459]